MALKSEVSAVLVLGEQVCLEVNSQPGLHCQANGRNASGCYWEAGKGRGCGDSHSPRDTRAHAKALVDYPAVFTGHWRGGRFCLWGGFVLPNRPQMRNRESSEDKRHLLTSHHLFVLGIQHRDCCPLPKGLSFLPMGFPA